LCYIDYMEVKLCPFTVLLTAVDRWIKLSTLWWENGSS